MTSISEACVYPTLATFHCILYGRPGSFCMHKAEHLSRAERDGDARRIGGSDRQGRHPVTAVSHQLLLGDGGQSREGSPGGSFLTDIIHEQPTQMVFIQMRGQHRGLLTVQPSVRWSGRGGGGGDLTHEPPPAPSNSSAACLLMAGTLSTLRKCGLNNVEKG